MTSELAPRSVRNGPGVEAGPPAPAPGSDSDGMTAEAKRLAAVAYDDAPAAFLIAGHGEGRETACRAARVAGCRVVEAEGIGEAQARPEWPPAAYPVVLELGTGGEEEALVPLLGRIEAEARRGRRAVVSAPLALIDLVAACIDHPHVELLCEASQADRVAAIARAANPPPSRFEDAGRESARLLQQLSEEVARIAHILASMSAEERGEAEPAEAGEEGESAPLEPGYVRTLIRARRLRDQYLGPNLFADPAWDMMLDLMAARLERNRVAVSSLCIAAAVPPTTALRWIKALTDRGLFVRRADPRDGRRVYIELSDQTARSLAAYLRDVQRVAPIAI